MLRIPDIQIPTDADLKPLYDAAEAYGKAHGAEFDRWSEVKKATGDEANGHKVAYADPEVKRLRAVAESLSLTMVAAVKEINARFPELDLTEPGPWVGICGYSDADLESYKKYVGVRLHDYVGSHWNDSNREWLMATRKDYRSRPFATTAAPGMILCSETDAYRVTKVTHNGKRIRTTEVIGQKEVNIRAADLDGFRVIDEALLGKIVAMYESRKATMDRYFPEAADE